MLQRQQYGWPCQHLWACVHFTLCRTEALSAAGAASWLAMSAVVSSSSFACAMLVVGSLGTACSDVVVDSIVVERCRGAPQVGPSRYMSINKGCIQGSLTQRCAALPRGCLRCVFAVQALHSSGSLAGRLAEAALPGKPTPFEGTAVQSVCCRPCAGAFRWLPECCNRWAGALPRPTLCPTCSFRSLCACCTATFEASFVLLCKLGAVSVLRSCTAVSNIMVRNIVPLLRQVTPKVFNGTEGEQSKF